MPEDESVVPPVQAYTERGWRGWFQDFGGHHPIPRTWTTETVPRPPLEDVPLRASNLVEAAILAHCSWLLRIGDTPGEDPPRFAVKIWPRDRPYEYFWSNGRMKNKYYRTTPPITEMIAMLTAQAVRLRGTANG